MEKGPHVPIFTPIVIDETEIRLVANQVAKTRPTNDDIDKMEKDEIAFYKISYGVPPNSFNLIINYKSGK